MGIHTESGDITDIGGGVKKDETDIIAGSREFSEETRGIFDTLITQERLSSCLSITVPNKPKNSNSNNWRKKDLAPSKIIPSRSKVGDNLVIYKENQNVNKLASQSVKTGGMTVIFLPLSNNWFDKAPKLFQEASTKIDPSDKSQNELSELLWVNESDFINFITKNKFIHLNSIPKCPLFGVKKSYKMWTKLINFYSGIYTQDLKTILVERWNNEALLHECDKIKNLNLLSIKNTDKFRILYESYSPFGRRSLLQGGVLTTQSDASEHTNHVLRRVFIEVNFKFIISI
jgi:hypothetical protein